VIARAIAMPVAGDIPIEHQRLREHDAQR